MMKYFICILFLISSTACAKTPSTSSQTSGIPVSVSNVQVNLVGDSIVRAIQHNMEINPIVQFEIMSRPAFEVLKTLTIESVPYQGVALSFKNSTGAFVESITFNDNNIILVFDYFYKTGGSVLLACTLAVENNDFLPLTCTKK